MICWVYTFLTASHKLFLPSFRPSFLPFFLSFFLPSFLPFFISFFIPFFIPVLSLLVTSYFLPSFPPSPVPILYFVFLFPPFCYRSFFSAKRHFVSPSFLPFFLSVFLPSF